jgi:hypothetical protein
VILIACAIVLFALAISDGLWLVALVAVLLGVGQALVLVQTQRQLRRRPAAPPPEPAEGRGPPVIDAPRRRPGSRRR